MPPKTLSVTPVDSDGKVNATGLADAVEFLRRGTREQYVSDWTSIADSSAATFTHSLEEIPWVVDVTRSEASDGARAVDSNAAVTIVKNSSSIIITNNAGGTYYFRVRAM